MNIDGEVPIGTKRSVDGQWRVFYDGYWIKAVRSRRPTRWPPRKALIQALTRRLFNHVEHGLNIPGTRLEEARRAFDAETDPQQQAGQGRDAGRARCSTAPPTCFTKVVELQALGVRDRSDNALMHQCGSTCKRR